MSGTALLIDVYWTRGVSIGYNMWIMIWYSIGIKCYPFKIGFECDRMILKSGPLWISNVWLSTMVGRYDAYFYDS